MRFAANQFVFVPDSNCYVAEASELGLPVGRFPEVVEVWHGDDIVRRYQNPVADPPGGEDVAGYRYSGVLPQHGEVLIIND